MATNATNQKPAAVDFVSGARAFLNHAAPWVPTGRSELTEEEMVRLIQFACSRFRRQIEADAHLAAPFAALLAKGTELLQQKRQLDELDALGHNVEEALRFAASELCTLGFERSMVFQVKDRSLRAVATEFVAAPDWRSNAHANATANPIPLLDELFEADVLHEQRCALIRSPIANPRAWQPVVNDLQCADYVVAPIVVGTVSVGTIHADCYFTDTALDLGHRDSIGQLAATISRSLTLSESDTKATNESTACHKPLSGRECEVLDLLALGLSNAAIAAELIIGRETVKTHVSQILRKLQVPNRAAAAAWAAANSGGQRLGH